MAATAPPGQRTASLLELDPELGAQSLDAARMREARRRLLVRVRRIPAGPWDTHTMHVADAGHIGLLVLEGVLAREVLAADIVSTELLGPGEVLRTWELAPDAELLRASVRWSILSDVRVAVLDRRLAAQLGDFPEVSSMLVERLSKRASRLAVGQAISQLNKVDRRLLTLFWQLAERWGRMTPEGVVIPLTLSHRMLSQLVGARRPTVSTALAELGRQGEVRRLENGSWLLTGRPAGEPAGDLRSVPPRRRFIAAEVADEPEERLTAVPADHVPSGAVRFAAPREEIRARLDQLRSDFTRNSADLRSAVIATGEIARRTQELRTRRERARAAHAGRVRRPA